MLMKDAALCGHVILVVEDDTLIAFDLQKNLEDAGAQVAHAGVQDALELVAQRSLSAAVLDCHPVSRERRALVRRLKQRGVPFLFYSAQPPADVTTERGAPFIAKPCPPEKIIAAVRYLLRRF